MRKFGVLFSMVLSAILLGGPASASIADVPAVSSWTPQVEIQQMLVDLSGTQSENLIQDAIDSGNAVQILVDSDTADFLAVVKLEEIDEAVAPLAISPVGPGCGTNAACIRSNNAWLGYAGTGTKIQNWTNATLIRDGSALHRTTFSWGAHNLTPQPNVTFTFPTPVTVKKIYRVSLI
ncbi:hypothetical protein V5R04_04385 [Jonesiaceae bacterium BS-20]|uniref:Uncharacterized protein n=1 Tax=Jonesiaceae bacterium BS-20 TaxID=3120821 RepID=A0AAU7DZR5_9MICO